MPGEMRAPRRPYEARVAQHADRAFAGGLGGQQIPRPIQNLEQNRRQVPKEPPTGELAYDYDNDIYFTSGSQTLNVGSSFQTFVVGSSPSPSSFNWGTWDGTTNIITVTRSGWFSVFVAFSTISTSGSSNVLVTDTNALGLTIFIPAVAARSYVDMRARFIEAGDFFTGPTVQNVGASNLTDVQLNLSIFPLVPV